MICILDSKKKHGRSINNYRPHPKDGGRKYFHIVCQSTPWWGGVYPISGLEWGYSIPTQDWIGYPMARTGRGTPSWSWLDAVPLLAKTGWGTPQPGLDRVPPGQDWIGYPSWPGLDGLPPPPTTTTTPLDWAA